MRVSELFKSVQGEGAFSGVVASFVRLSGCNALEEGLGCTRWCDTAYSWGKRGERESEELTIDEVGSQLSEWDSPLIVLTGGEPLLQWDSILELITTHKQKSWLAVETNGTIARPDVDLWWTVSPKPPYWRLGEGPISEVKIVLGLDDDVHTGPLNELLRGATIPSPFTRLYMQPRDNDLSVAKYLAEDVLPEFPQWRLNLQLHKLLAVQ